MTVTFAIDVTVQELSNAAASALAEELYEYANGYRGNCDNPASARELAIAIERRLDQPAADPITISDLDTLDALHRTLNATVDQIGPTMQLYNAVDMARRSSWRIENVQFRRLPRHRVDGPDVRAIAARGRDGQQSPTEPSLARSTTG